MSGKGISPMIYKVKAITDLVPATNISEGWHIIGLKDYYKKFFPTLIDIIWPWNELTKKTIPFKWTEDWQKSLDYIKQIITISLILAHTSPDKKYYHFMESRKHTWSGVLIQYHEQKTRRQGKFKCTPSNYVSEWKFLRFTKILEHANKRSICYIHII